MKPSISPMTDIAFHYIFAQGSGVEALRSLLSAVLEDAGFRPLRDVQIISPFRLGRFESGVGTGVDVRVVDTGGRLFTVELQTWSQRVFVERSIFHWARAYGRQLSHGQERLLPVVGVNLLEFTLFEEEPEAHTCFQIRRGGGRSAELLLTDHLQLHYIELAKIGENAPANGSTALGRWLYYMKYCDKREVMHADRLKQLIAQDAALAEAERRRLEFSQDPVLQEHYRSRRAVLMNVSAATDSSWSRGHEETRWEIARRMKAEGFSNALIARACGLGQEELTRL